MNKQHTKQFKEDAVHYYESHKDDYREEIDINQNQRWSDRFTIDGTWENNLYNFYFTVINKLTSNVKVPFKLENLERKDDTLVHQAIRGSICKSNNTC